MYRGNFATERAGRSEFRALLIVGTPQPFCMMRVAPRERKYAHQIDNERVCFDIRDAHVDLEKTRPGDLTIRTNPHAPSN